MLIAAQRRAFDQAAGLTPVAPAADDTHAAEHDHDHAADPDSETDHDQEDNQDREPGGGA